MTDDLIPDTPLFDRARQQRGYRLNKMAMGLTDPANRDAFRNDEEAYLDSFNLTGAEKQAVKARDWRELPVAKWRASLLRERLRID